MKDIICKIALCTGAVIAAIFLLAIFIFIAASTGKIKPWYNTNGRILENSIAEKTIVSLNGADNGLIIRGKNLDNPVMLFVSSGPGTSDYFYNETYPAMNLEEFFTVCYWDYRGMCLVYDRNIEPASITAAQIIADTKAVTEYLKKRFNREKIYIMGFSGGTHIGLEAASIFPEDYFAYIGMAQVVCHGEENDSLMYEFMKETFIRRNQSGNLKKLEKSVNHDGSGKVTCKNWPDYVFLLHKAGGGTIKDKTEFSGIIVPILKAKCYTVKEKINYIRGMKMYRTTPFYEEIGRRDYRSLITKLEVPAYFISGNWDYNCPWPLVEQYCRQLEAPKKDFLLVENSAHSPLWENPAPVVDFLKEIADAELLKNAGF